MGGHHDGELHELLLDLLRSVGLLHLIETGPEPALSLSEIFALHELDHGHALAQQELAALLRLDKSTVSRLVAALERRGLLLRERDPVNRRIVRLQLTEAGRQAHQRTREAFHLRYLDLLAGLSLAERSALSAGLGGLLRELHRAAPAAQPGHEHDPLPVPPARSRATSGT